MKVKLILPALTEAKSPFFRPIKYSLFPPLGLAQLAGYFDPDDEITLQDEHVETLDLDDEPDLVVIQVYITSAYRSYEIADHYRRRSIFRGASTKERWSDRLRRVAYAGGWKKLEPMWDVVIRAKRATSMLP